MAGVTPHEVKELRYRVQQIKKEKDRRMSAEAREKRRIEILAKLAITSDKYYWTAIDSAAKAAISCISDIHRNADNTSQNIFLKKIDVHRILLSFSNLIVINAAVDNFSPNELKEMDGSCYPNIFPLIKGFLQNNGPLGDEVNNKYGAGEINFMCSFFAKVTNPYTFPGSREDDQRLIESAMKVYKHYKRGHTMEYPVTRRILKKVEEYLEVAGLKMSISYYGTGSRGLTCTEFNTPDEMGDILTVPYIEPVLGI